MRLRHLVESCAAIALALGAGTAALAQQPGTAPAAAPTTPPAPAPATPDNRPDWNDARPGASYTTGARGPAAGVYVPPADAPPADLPAPGAYARQAYAPNYGMDPGARARWLGECRRRVSDSGVGGAIIGGVLGGFAGNRIGGRRHRTTGTITGAAVGAVAGAAIDRAEDRDRTRDECETYLDDYYAYYAQAGQGYGYGQSYGGYAYPGYGYAAAGCCQAARAEPECTETVEVVYDDVPVRPRARRLIPARRVPDKRIRIN